MTIEWVGDMSTPSVLPKRIPSLPLEPGTAMGDLMGDGEMSSDEDMGTVKKTESPWKHGGRAVLPFGSPRDLFSEQPESRVLRPSLRPSDITTGSPLCREHPRRKSLLRPRIATETFTSPQHVSFALLDKIPLTNPNPSHLPTPTQHQHQQQIRSQKHPSPPSPPLPSPSPSPTLIPQTSPLPAQDSDLSDTEYFTPPCTTQRHKLPKPRVPARPHRFQHTPPHSANPAPTPFTPTLQSETANVPPPLLAGSRRISLGREDAPRTPGEGVWGTERFSSQCVNGDGDGCLDTWPSLSLSKLDSRLDAPFSGDFTFTSLGCVSSTPRPLHPLHPLHAQHRNRTPDELAHLREEVAALKFEMRALRGEVRGWMGRVDGNG